MAMDGRRCGDYGGNRRMDLLRRAKMTCNDYDDADDDYDPVTDEIRDMIADNDGMLTNTLADTGRLDELFALEEALAAYATGELHGIDLIACANDARAALRHVAEKRIEERDRAEIESADALRDEN